VLIRALFPLLFAVYASAATEPQGIDVAPIKQWLARQDKLHTLSADFEQIRAFHSLRDPLVSKGHFWFAAPSSFRWEVGDPAKLIYLRKKETIYVIQPPKKRAQQVSQEQLQQQASPALFKFPLAKDFDDFNRQFDLRAVVLDGTHCHADVAPKDPLTRKLITTIKFDFDTETGKLLSAEMDLKEGSSMRNDFKNVQINPKLDAGLFEYDLTGYQVTSGH
jgi:outer membrane lipoprotein-sorting protein